VVVLHEYGEAPHYLGLKRLCEERDIKLEFLEFSFIKGIVKSILTKDKKRLKKEIKNAQFLLTMPFKRDERIVLGIAPFDWRLVLLKAVLRNHKVFYHTSWSEWNGEFYPKKRFVNNFVKNIWKRFLKRSYIFTVSQRAKKSLIENCDIKNISVVYHAFDEKIFFHQNREREYDFIYAGRLESLKGIEELLDIFSKRKERLLIVGDGILRKRVENYANRYANIVYRSKVDKKELAKLFNKARFIILNSKKTDYWEELFGMVLIEAMACGCIPIAVSHPGPQEIVTEDCGILFDEGELDTVLQKLNFLNEKELRKKAIQRSMIFTSKNISKLWSKVLE